MERKVFLISSHTQRQTIIDSKAETLGELKKELDNLNINYTDMAFFEGRTKVELKSDNTILPSNFSFKGTITNDLTIMLTKPHKKIKSGIMTRKECYDYIKSNNLSKVFAEVYGKNYTNASTLVLNEFCDPSEDPIIEDVMIEEVKAEKEPSKDETSKEKSSKIEYYLKEILDILVKLDFKLNQNALECKAPSEVSKAETKEKTPKKEVKEFISETEISEMFDFI